MALKKFKEFNPPSNSFFILVTFDLDETDKLPSGVYDDIEKELRVVKFGKKFKSSKGKHIELPYNTFGRVLTSKKGSKEIKDLVAREVDAVFEKLELEGKFLVFVGMDWSSSVKRFRYTPKSG